jgi:hypothetical protein
MTFFCSFDMGRLSIAIAMFVISKINRLPETEGLPIILVRADPTLT